MVNIYLNISQQLVGTPCCGIFITCTSMTLLLLSQPCHLLQKGATNLISSVSRKNAREPLQDHGPGRLSNRAAPCCGLFGRHRGWGASLCLFRLCLLVRVSFEVLPSPVGWHILSRPVYFLLDGVAYARWQGATRSKSNSYNDLDSIGAESVFVPSMHTQQVFPEHSGDPRLVWQSSS
jgi:hypothetical protein